MGSRLASGIKVGNWDQGWQLGSRLAIGIKVGNWDIGWKWDQGLQLGRRLAIGIKVCKTIWVLLNMQWHGEV